MCGTDFEHYLVDVFTFLGYRAERLGGAGDQGVDLIVYRQGAKIAVQAKCYRTALGNAPIQEVYAGAAIHGCNLWVVITNSTFTRGGIEAANATGTILIDGTQLPALVRGLIRL
jgi:restriction system protein